MEQCQGITKNGSRCQIKRGLIDGKCWIHRIRTCPDNVVQGTLEAYQNAYIENADRIIETEIQLTRTYAAEYRDLLIRLQALNLEIPGIQELNRDIEILEGVGNITTQEEKLNRREDMILLIGPYPEQLPNIDFETYKYRLETIGGINRRIIDESSYHFLERFNDLANQIEISEHRSFPIIQEIRGDFQAVSDLRNFGLLRDILLTRRMKHLYELSNDELETLARY